MREGNTHTEKERGKEVWRAREIFYPLGYSSNSHMVSTETGSQECHLILPRGWQVSKYLDHLSLLFLGILAGSWIRNG